MSCHHASWQWDPKQVTPPLWPSLKWGIKGLTSYKAPQVVPGMWGARKACQLLLLLSPWVAIIQWDKEWSNT